MKRAWAVSLSAAVLLGCRSSQPATNPFLRTTVPPPATGAVVTPGEPYYPPGAVPSTAPPTVVAPGTAAPPPFAPVPAAPAPVIIPPKDKFGPPGGSFQYNQSSNERRKVGPRTDVDGDEEALAATVVSRSFSQTGTIEDVQLTPKDAVQNAVLLSAEADEIAQANYHEMVAAQEEAEGAFENRDQPPEKVARKQSEVKTALHVVRTHVTAKDDEPVASSKLRITAGESRRSAPSSAQKRAGQDDAADRRADATDADAEPEMLTPDDAAAPLPSE